MSTTTIFPFTTAGNYTASDSDRIEVSGGVGTLKTSGATATATYTSSLNFDWADGTLTATTTGTPTVDGGYAKLDSGEIIEYVYTDGNIPEDNTGCIRMSVQPQYSGSPSATTYYLSCQNSGNQNAVFIQHQTNGSLIFSVYSSSGSLSVNISSAWSPTSGQDYIFECNWDGATGASRFFIDGTQVGITDNTTFTRTGMTVDTMDIGRGSSEPFWVKWFEIFDEPQNTANHTANTAGPIATRYSTASPNLLTNTAISGNILTFSATENTTGSDTVTYAIKVNGTDYYWTGSAWATSSGSAQTNTAAEINTNIPTLDTGNNDVTIRTYLNSDDGTTTPTIDSITVTYDAADQAATEPTFCYLEGYLYDYNGPVSGQLIEVRPTAGFASSEIFVSHDWQTFDTTASDGYFAGRIWESASTGNTWEFRIGTKKYRVSVPNATSAKWSDLTITAVTSS